MTVRLRNTILISIFAISALMHVKHFSTELMSVHVWRQTQTQSTIINFYEEDMNILNPRKNDRGNSSGIFRMEFPLMQWLVACQYKLFGNHLIITRIFMFIVGLISILGIYRLLDVLFQNVLLSLIGAWAFTFSPSFFYYTINPLPDNLALCFSIWGLALFFSWLHNKKYSTLVISGLLLSLGTLCKLPFVIYFVVPATHFFMRMLQTGLNRKLFLQMLGAMGSIVLPLIWYASVIPTWQNNPIVLGILGNEDSSSKLLDYFQHNLISTLPELLLNYGSVLFFLAGFYFLFKNRAYKDSRFVLLIALSLLVLIYYIFEANAIAKVHDYYLFPFYPLLFMLVAYGGFHIYKSKKYLAIALLIILPLSCYLRMNGRWDPDSPGFNKDLLQHKTELRNVVPKDALVVAGNDQSHFILFYYIDKKGWGFDNDNLNARDLKAMIDNGAEYLYTDSENIYTKQEIIPNLDKLILEKGSFRVYSLKKQLPLN